MKLSLSKSPLFDALNKFAVNLAQVLTSYHTRQLPESVEFSERSLPVPEPSLSSFASSPSTPSVCFLLGFHVHTYTVSRSTARSHRVRDLSAPRAAGVADNLLLPPSNKTYLSVVRYWMEPSSPAPALRRICCSTAGGASCGPIKPTGAPGRPS